MKLWISSETQSDVFDDFRKASLKVEDCINEVIVDKTYGLALDGWDCIAILRNDDDFEELVQYSPKKKEMDFRLRIDYESFKSGNDLEREQLVFGMLIRSLKLLNVKGLDGDGMESLESDVKSVGAAKGWQ